MKNIIINGGTGLIGGHIYLLFLEKEIIFL